MIPTDPVRVTGGVARVGLNIEVKHVSLARAEAVSINRIVRDHSREGVRETLTKGHTHIQARVKVVGASFRVIPGHDFLDMVCEFVDHQALVVLIGILVFLAEQVDHAICRSVKRFPP